MNNIREKSVRKEKYLGKTYRKKLKFYSRSDGDRRVWDSNDVAAEAVDGLCVHVMDPLVSRLPNHNPDPEAEVGRHQVDEPKPGEQPKPLDNDGRVHEQKVHLQEGKQSLKCQKLILEMVFR